MRKWILLAALLLPSVVFATNWWHWKGGGTTNNPTGGDWDVAANWEEGTIPVSGTNTVLIFRSGATAYTSVNNLPGLDLNAVSIADGDGNAQVNIDGADGTIRVGTRRSNGVGSYAALTLTQTSSIGFRQGDVDSDVGVLNSTLGSGWTSYVRSGFQGRTIGAMIRDLPHGDYIFYVCGFNPNNIHRGHRISIGSGSAESGSLSTTAIPYVDVPADPQLGYWEDGTNYVELPVTINAASNVAYIIVSGEEVGVDEFDLITLSFFQIVGVTDTNFIFSANYHGGYLGTNSPAYASSGKSESKTFNAVNATDVERIFLSSDMLTFVGDHPFIANNTTTAVLDFSTAFRGDEISAYGVINQTRFRLGAGQGAINIKHLIIGDGRILVRQNNWNVHKITIRDTGQLGDDQTHTAFNSPVYFEGNGQLRTGFDGKRNFVAGGWQSVIPGAGLIRAQTTIIGGYFFDSCPQGGEVYTFSGILGGFGNPQERTRLRKSGRGTQIIDTNFMGGDSSRQCEVSEGVLHFLEGNTWSPRWANQIVLVETKGEFRFDGTASDGSALWDVYGILSGYGTIQRPVRILEGGRLTPDGSMTIDRAATDPAFSMADTAVYNVTLGTNTTLLTVVGNVELDGTIDVTEGAGFGDGAYVVMTYTGTVIDNGITVTGVSDYTLTTDGGQVVITVGDDVRRRRAPEFKDSKTWYPNKLW